ncbi:hypothetical protein HanLR1_Chr16g0608641 [Helianthus annuus]|nr:hypothetical protein HanLR1_Chr16g0608641 [Helianthus annuus]
MNSIDLRTEKANAIFRHQTNFQTITTLFRLIEICVFLVLISTFSSQLPFSVRISTDYFKQISFAGISPRFVFVIGNVIILTLLFKSRAKENEDSLGKIDVYDECVRRCQKSIVNRTTDVIVHDNYNNNNKKKIYRSQSEKMMRFECNDSEKYRKLTRSVTDRRILKLKNIEFCAGEKPSPEKVMSVESHRKLTRSVTDRRILTNVDGCGGEKPSPEKVKRSPEICRKALPEISRSQSEKMMRVEFKESESERKLRRTVTEREMLRNDDSSSVPERNVEELSSEAFRRTVEEFIARQQQSLRDEELAPVHTLVHEA